MKKIFKVLTSCVVLLLILSLKTKAYDSDFIINDFHVDMIVNENGQIEVTESLNVHFKNPYKHGIYFSLPLKYNMEIDGKMKKYHFPIYDYKATKGNLADKEYSDNNLILVLGDKDRYVNEYEQYQIKYKVKTTKIETADLSDIFYWNLIYRWEATVESFSFNVDFPKAIDENKLHFYSGQLKDKEAINYQITKSEIFKDGVRISGKVNGVVQPTQSVTMHLNLGKDYFNFPDYNYGYLVVIIFSGAICLLSIFFFLKYGKDPLVIKTVEFKAPDDLNSAECGYILKEVTSNEQVLSLIYYLASKKYLSIKEDEEGKIVITKLKGIDKNLKQEEVLIFDALFENGITCYVEDVSVDFYKKFLRSFEVIKRRINKKLYEQKNYLYLYLSIALIIFFHFLFFTFGEFYFSNKFFSLKTVLFLVPSILYDVLFTLMFGIYLKNKNKTIILFLIVWTIVPFSLIFLMAKANLENKFMLYLLIESIIVFISLIFASLITKRTDYGALIKGKILGLNDFIRYAEQDRLKALVKEYPQLFYDILPYAFAFGLSDLWIHHFNNLIIPPNEGYLFIGDNRDDLFYGFNRINNGINNGVAKAFVEHEARTSRSNGSGGGGFSSGGGGFSGGGFGGSSGGSW